METVTKGRQPATLSLIPEMDPAATLSMKLEHQTEAISTETQDTTTIFKIRSKMLLSTNADNLQP